ncbi:MAG: hypothetical protein R2752_13575 [Vicinamibacterales bacterium]
MALVVAIAGLFGLGPLADLGPARGLRSVPQFARYPWRQDGPTVVLALSTRCQACLQNTGFYRDLASAAEGKFDLIATFDEPGEEAQRRLGALGISAPTVMTIPHAALGVDDVPALLLVDGQGGIKASWNGPLTAVQQREVAAALGITLPTPAAAPVANAPESVAPDSKAAVAQTGEAAEVERPSVRALRAAYAKPGENVILDIRAQDQFRLRHLDGSANIPWDELRIRAVHEIDQAKTVFVQCSRCPTCEKNYASVASSDVCVKSLERLGELGFRHVEAIDATLDDLAKAGFRLIEGARR